MGPKLGVKHNMILKKVIAQSRDFCKECGEAFKLGDKESHQKRCLAY